MKEINYIGTDGCHEQYQSQEESFDKAFNNIKILITKNGLIPPLFS